MLMRSSHPTCHYAFEQPSCSQELPTVAGAFVVRLALQVEEVRDVRVRDCAVRVKQGSSAKQTKGALTSFECWLEFEVKRSG